jgi:hypothetical protein
MVVKTRSSPDPETRVEPPAKVVPTAVNDNPARDPADRARGVLRRMVAVAWMSIVLGLLMQGTILAGKSWLGAPPALAQLLIDLVNGVTWSFLVCAGIGLGTTIAKARATIGGLIGLISAPIALGIAKGSQKVMISALGAADKPVILSLATLGTLRAIEYGLLGWLLAWLVWKQEGRVSRYLAAGAAIGIAFGGTITALTIWTAHRKGLTMPPPAQFATSINEIVFPIGCAFVVFVGLQVGRQIKLLNTDK